MPNAIIFGDLPATFPPRNRHKTAIAFGSVGIHIILVATLIIVPLFLPPTMEGWRLVTLTAPPPPPAAPAPAASVSTSAPSAPAVQRIVALAPDALIMPIVVPKEIARFVDNPGSGVMGGVPGGVVGGVPGGMPGGVTGGLFSGILQASIGHTGFAPPPPPPPPPPTPAPVVESSIPVAPIHVGGDVKEPRAIRVVPVRYPSLAKMARVQGRVSLEAILTVDGSVDEVRVISGNPLLTEAAIECVKQWQYEPSYLNGRPVPVILTATVDFILKHP